MRITMLTLEAYLAAARAEWAQLPGSAADQYSSEVQQRVRSDEDSHIRLRTL